MLRTLKQYVLSLFVVCLNVSFYAGHVDGTEVKYLNYHVYEVTPTDKFELAVLRNIERSSHTIIFQEPVHSINQTAELIVAPHRVPGFERLMDQYDIDYKLVDPNLQGTLERKGNFQLDAYNELQDTYDWLYSLAREFPDEVTITPYGKTYEHSDLLCVKVSLRQEKPHVKDNIMLVSGMNGQEWIGPATVLFILSELLAPRDPDIRHIAQAYDWYIIPHANPDGYEYTHRSDRLWSKNRQRHGEHIGANLRLNWQHNWGQAGASKRPCSPNYAGAKPFSEIETDRLSAFIAKLGLVNILISFNSFGQMLHYPYGDPDSMLTYYKRRICEAAINGIKQRYGTKYICGSKKEMGQPESGNFIDWAAYDQNIDLAYSYQLRPAKRNYVTGYQLPPSEIIPTGEETLDSLHALIYEASRLQFISY